MALFLNTPKLNHWIPKLIEESEEELILIVPYIQTSENILNALKIADGNGVEITLIYRENKLSEIEKNKLLSLKNINLLHHPNIHCKCYYNGDLLILGSMNLYEYSEKNNREMGMLLHRIELDEKGNVHKWGSSDKKEIFNDAIVEIREIVNGASLEKYSKKAKEASFEINIIKTDEELEGERCNGLNKHFYNKKFKPFEYTENTWYSKCYNFFDNVDIVLEHHRISIKFNLEYKELEKLHNSWMNIYQEFEYDGFKYYWNRPKEDLFLYKHDNFDWDNTIKHSIKYKKMYEGISSVISRYRELTGK